MSSVRYEVTVELEPALAERFVKYMTGQHAPEIFSTGCFRSIRLDRAGPTTFRTTYEHQLLPASSRGGALPGAILWHDLLSRPLTPPPHPPRFRAVEGE